MGITLALLNEMRHRRLLARPGQRILDVGSSNLYQADVDGVADFVRAFRGQADERDLRAFAERLAKGSAYDFVKGGTNEAFVGELLDRCGLHYLSLDIARGYKTELFDLNRQDLPHRHREAFDVVLNIGTTEHVLNQYNSFKVIHDATKVGGYMVHQLPISGFTDHGYFVYTGRMLFDLAGFNHYEVTALWHEGPAGEDNVFHWARSFAHVCERLGPLDVPSGVSIPNFVLTVAFRKARGGAFVGALDTGTSVGHIPASVQAAYAGSALRRLKAHARASLQRSPRFAAAVRKLLRR